MTRKAFDQIAEGLEEALAVARGDAEPFRLHVPSEIDVKAIRARTGLSQRTSPPPSPSGWISSSSGNRDARVRCRPCGPTCCSSTPTPPRW